MSRYLTKQEAIELLEKKFSNALEDHVSEYLAEYIKDTYPDTDDDGEPTEVDRDDLERDACNCAGGCVSHLIYYVDTKEFFNKYESEITDTIVESGMTVAEFIKDDDTISNKLAWVGFELAASNVLSKVFG